MSSWKTERGLQEQTTWSADFQDAMSTQWRKKIFLTNGAGTTGYPHRKKLGLNFYSTLCPQMKLEWIIGLIIKPRTFQKRNIRENLKLRIGKDFFQVTKALAIQEKKSITWFSPK